ncbi:ClpP/crotonase [Balamuthia mandrillaris]
MAEKQIEEGAALAAYEEVLFSVKNNVGTLTLNRPNKGNSITPKMGEEIKHAIQRFIQDPQVRVIVITGAGKYFCTGMDLGSSNQKSMQERVGTSDGVAASVQIYETLKACPKPIITKINGGALGGGFGLVFTSDIRIASKKAWFWFAEVKRGLAPLIISAYIVPQIGTFQAKQWMLTGRKISATEAMRLGFITAVADEGKLDEVTQQYVKELLGSAPKAMRLVKESVEHVANHPHEANIEYVTKNFPAMLQSEEALYGMSCFMQRKQPDWGSLQQPSTTAKL